jgi:hypothetical protein
MQEQQLEEAHKMLAGTVLGPGISPAHSLGLVLGHRLHAACEQ